MRLRLGSHFRHQCPKTPLYGEQITILWRDLIDRYSKFCTFFGWNRLVEFISIKWQYRELIAKISKPLHISSTYNISKQVDSGLRIWLSKKLLSNFYEKY
uniref:Uncharacterized protein n=1 Tax=Cacopsylla melanoneura TaxID=428564 RepID=A0A8D8U5K0_9HEMI